MVFIRKILLSGIIIIVAATGTYPDTLDINLSIKEIRKGLFIVEHAYPWPSNSVIAVMENGDILVVDTPYTPQAMERVLEWTRNRFGARSMKAIITHFHIDRLGGNETLLKNKIPVYSSELTPLAIKKRGRASLKLLISWVSDSTIRNHYENFQYVAPDTLFDSKKGLTLVFGNEKVIIDFPGVAHSIDNLVVYMPGKKAIIAGCMILSSGAKNAGNASDGSVNEWEKTLTRIDTNGYDLIIPGHGKPGGIELIEHTRSIVEK